MMLRYLIFSLLSLSASAAHAQTSASMEPVAGFGLGPGQPSRAGLFYKASTGKFYGTSSAGGAFGAGTVFEMDETGRIQALSFTEQKNEQAFPGSRPSSEFVESSDGWLWTTYTNYGLGNAQQLGGIVRLRPETGECQVMARFTGNTGMFPGSWPQGGLVRSADGNLWGTTFYTANNNTGAGTIFRIHEITGEFESVHSFPGTGGQSGGARPQGSLHNDGNGSLWGVTQFAGAAMNGSSPSGSGSVFKFNMSTRDITVYNIFAGSNPQEGKITGSFPNNSLVPDGRGFLWGTVSKDNTFGSVYKIEIATGTAIHVADYNKNGNNLAVNLMRDHQGNLWGYTSSDGTSGVNKGSLFKVDSGTDTLTTEFNFSSLSGANADITGPASALVRTSDGHLWGIATTSSGGWAAYKFNPNGAVFTRLSGGRVRTGHTPQAGVVGSPGSNWLWGSTAAGGLHDFGTLYRVDPASGQMETLVHFTGTTGAAAGTEPSGTLAIAADGVVWGTTRLGGAGNFGTVFKYDPGTAVFTSVHAFTASGNGASPRGVILPGDGSYAWGVTNAGSDGTVYKIETATSVHTKVFNFTSTTGRSPDCQLVEDAGGMLWGTTTRNGTHSGGSIFKVDPATGTTTIVYHLNPAIGQPVNTRAGGAGGSLHLDVSGHLWGTWSYSSYNIAGVFRFNTATSVLENVFTNTVGSAYPILKGYPGTLGADHDGKLNFLVSEAVKNASDQTLTRDSLYQIDPADATPAAAKTAVLEEGMIYEAGPANAPIAPFYAHSDGFLYGINSARGLNRDLSPAGGGMLYRVRPGPAVTTVNEPPSGYNSLYHSYAIRTNATLRATVSPNGQTITGWEFEWGPTTALGNTVTATAGTLSETGILVTASLSGLAPYMTYYFRPVIHTAAGAAYGRMQSLETDSHGTWPPLEGSQILVESPRGMALPDSTSSASVDLGRVLVGESWKQAVIARSVGPNNLNIQSAVLTGDPAFSITTEMPIGSLATDKMAGMFVTYAPTSPGEHTATLTITSNDGDDFTYEITFSAEGVQEPDIQVELASDGSPVPAGGQVNFGSSAIGGATPNQTLNIINAGNATLENISVELIGPAKDDYGLVSVPGASLLEGGSTNLVVSFTPSQAGTRNATLRIQSNDPDQPVYDIELTGAALAMPEIVVETSGGSNLVDGSGTIQFGNVPFGGSGSQQIVIKNTGDAPLTGVSVNVIGQPQYTVTSSVPATIAAGASITVEITLSPLAALPVIAQLEIGSNDSDENPFNLTLNGSGVSAPEIAVEVDVAALTDNGPAVSFETSAGLAATQTFTIRNVGNQALTGLALSLDGAGFSATALGQTSVAAGQSLTFDVTFSPVAEGEFSATLQIASNDADENPFAIALTGTATAQVGGKPLFGPITLGPSSVAQPVNQTITATGSPTRYTAKGLPKGVKMDPVTGQLTGAPLAPSLVKREVQPYEVVFTAKNSEGSTSTEPIQWLVTPLAEGIVGTFNGLVARQAAVNGVGGSDTGLGGSIKVVVSSKGSFSGSLKNGPDSHGFKGVLEVPESGGDPEATVIIKRKKGLDPLELTFTVHPQDAPGDSAGTLAGDLFLGGQEAEVIAWLAQDTGLATGSYNLAFDDITGNATVRPEGSGYAILKVKPRAAVSWTGLLADGTRITGSSTLGANGSAGLYQVLYKKTGSLLMEVVVDPGTEVDGDMTWLKLPQTGRTPGYADGFFATCSVSGGLYTPPAKDARVLDLPENIILELWGGGDVDLVYPAALTTKNAVTVTDAGEKTKLKINAKTGIITGGFEQPGTKVRKAKAYGLMVPGLGGTGFFLLPEDSASRPEILSGALFLGEETP